MLSNESAARRGGSYASLRTFGRARHWCISRPRKCRRVKKRLCATTSSPLIKPARKLSWLLRTHPFSSYPNNNKAWRRILRALLKEPLPEVSGLSGKSHYHHAFAAARYYQDKRIDSCNVRAPPNCAMFVVCINWVLVYMIPLSM